jgi:hypothetical protein
MAGDVVEPAQSDWQRDELSTIRARLEAAAGDVTVKTTALELSRKLRDELVVHAVETGMSYRDVARAASLHHSRVLQILAAH